MFWGSGEIRREYTNMGEGQEERKRGVVVFGGGEEEGK